MLSAGGSFCTTVGDLILLSKLPVSLLILYCLSGVHDRCGDRLRNCAEGWYWNLVESPFHILLNAPCEIINGVLGGADWLLTIMLLRSL